MSDVSDIRCVRYPMCQMSDVVLIPSIVVVVVGRCRAALS